MFVEIYNQEEIKTYFRKAREENLKITYSSQENADDQSYTSNQKYIHLKNKMNKIIEVNTTYEYIVVESAVTWFDILYELDKHDYTLVSSQSGLLFSVGGSFCGNAHGKKTHIPMIKDTIIEFNFIDGKGEEHTVTHKDNIFNAFPGSLGLLGFITTMKIKIQKKYGIILNVEQIDLNQTSIDYIKSLSNNEKVCMVNFQSSYFQNIKDIVLSVYYYEQCSEPLEQINISKFNEHKKIFYTLIILLFWFMSKFDFFDQIRWNIERKTLLSLNDSSKCMNVNNSFDVWTKIYVPNFKIIEFFFPENVFLYGQQTMMELFKKHNMHVLSSGSRIVFEQQKQPGFLRFSQFASKSYPYLSLVINFVENKSHLEELTNDIREKILRKNIRMTYHTTYSWNFTKEDMLFMFPNMNHFIQVKKNLDPYNIFSNKFSEKYLI